MRESFAAASGGDVGDAPSSSKAQADLSLKPGTTLTINLGGKVNRNLTTWIASTTPWEGMKDIPGLCRPEALQG